MFRITVSKNKEKPTICNFCRKTSYYDYMIYGIKDNNTEVLHLYWHLCYDHTQEIVKNTRIKGSYILLFYPNNRPAVNKCDICNELISYVILDFKHHSIITCKKEECIAFGELKFV